MLTMTRERRPLADCCWQPSGKGSSVTSSTSSLRSCFGPRLNSVGGPSCVMRPTFIWSGTFTKRETSLSWFCTGDWPTTWQRPNARQVDCPHQGCVAHRRTAGFMAIHRARPWLWRRRARAGAGISAILLGPQQDVRARPPCRDHRYRCQEAFAKIKRVKARRCSWPPREPLFPTPTIP